MERFNQNFHGAFYEQNHGTTADGTWENTDGTMCKQIDFDFQEQTGGATQKRFYEVS